MISSSWCLISGLSVLVKHGGASPPGLPGVGDAADDGAEHESGDEGEENEVDEAFQPIVAQPRHGLDVVLQADPR